MRRIECKTKMSDADLKRELMIVLRRQSIRRSCATGVASADSGFNVRKTPIAHHRSLRVHKLVPLLATLISIFAPAFAGENFIPLPTELRVSSVSVSMRAPLGLRYRPGEAFPLELHIDNLASAMDAELLAIESGGTSDAGDWAERAVLPSPLTLPQGKSQFMLPMRAPAVSASIVLVLRGASNGGGRAELFRASLSRVLRPLNGGGRVILVCGSGAAPRGPEDQAAQLSARELPAESWMWESVDWVVLNDASIKDARAESRDALRRWLLGGGRIFLGSRDAFSAALAAHLLPLETTSDIGSDMNWWRKNTGLTGDDVLAASKNFRPVYARLKMGFGQIVFLFPGSDATDADGAAVFNRPDLQRHRAELPDARIQPDRFGAFVPAAPSAARRGAVMLWAGIGALILCAALIYAHTSRSKLEAALLPFGAGALLVALIAHGFPRPELMVSRVRLERRSADGAIVREEWALLESFRRPLETLARGPANGTLAPRFDALDDLRTARLERWNETGRLALGRIAVSPNQAAMLFAETTFEESKSEKVEVNCVIAIVGRSDGPHVRADAFDGMDARHLIWVRAKGEAWILTKAGESYEAEKYSSQALYAHLSQRSDASSAKAHGVAI